MRLSAPRIAPLTDAELTPEARAALDAVPEFARAFNIFRTQAHKPAALTAFLAWGYYILSAANALPDPVPEEVKQERLARFMELQAQISAEKLEARIGTVQRVLVDAIDGDLAYARSMADAPEIDGIVQIQDGYAAGLKPGQFAQVHILGSDEHDLYGCVELPDDADDYLPG